ncbi:MAG: hypothetical protein H6747_06060 [Deltaproteobacteria bacterium]|nr:hypothetical protein [Deltaproteobacteria bacterium]
MKRILTLSAALLATAALTAGAALAAGNDQKAKFYDFSDQLIDGDVKKPPTIVMEARTRAKFEKLLRLKKSFRQAMIDSSKEPILK